MESHVPIRIGTLRVGEMTGFPVYLQMTNKFVKYFNHDLAIEGDRLEKLKSKGVKKLYIESADEEKYLKFLDRAFEALDKSDVKPEEKAQVARDGLVTITENSKEQVKTEAGYKQMGGQMGRLISFFTSPASPVGQILSQAGVSGDKFEHSANVAMLSIKIANELKITDSKQLLNLGMAALLHDIGLETSELKPVSDMTPEELTEYQKHPTIGRDILNSKSYIDPAVLNLVYEHEEYGDGLGFPEKKHIKKMSLLNQILNLANSYDLFCKFKKMNPTDAGMEYMKTMVGAFDLEHIKVLLKVVKKS